MMHTEKEYLEYNPFYGDESVLTCRSKKMVVVRKQHACIGGTDHGIQPGQLARYEKALVDGSFFGRYYMCIPCLDEEMRP